MWTKQVWNDHTFNKSHTAIHYSPALLKVTAKVAVKILQGEKMLRITGTAHAATRRRFEIINQLDEDAKYIIENDGKSLKGHIFKN